MRHEERSRRSSDRCSSVFEGCLYVSILIMYYMCIYNIYVCHIYQYICIVIIYIGIIKHGLGRTMSGYLQGFLPEFFVSFWVICCRSVKGEV